MMRSTTTWRSTMTSPMTPKEMLEEIAREVDPNPATITKTKPFVDLLGLVVEEYILVDTIPLLTREERYEIAKWASVTHVAAASDDPPLPTLPRPEALKKILIEPGRRVLVEGRGMGTVVYYETATVSRPTARVKFEDGNEELVYNKRIIGVDE